MVEDDERRRVGQAGAIGALGRMFARHPYIHVLMLSVMFAAVIGAGAYATRDPTASLS